MRLHLGCGAIHLDGWVNIDRRYQPGVDRVENIGILQHFPLGGVETIYVCHALDHFDRWTYKMVLKRWFDLLTPYGELLISTPDFGWAVRHYQKTGRLEDLIGHLYAGQDYPDNVRHWVWDFAMAKRDLLSVGFAEVDYYRPTDYIEVEDCSMLKGNGEYRSLNVRARKKAL